MRTLTCDPKLEVYGQNLRAWIDNVQGYEVMPILEKHNLTNINPDQWYPTHQWLDVLNDLRDQGNLMSNLVAIGLQIGTTIPLPDNLTLPQVLMAWDDAYQHLHRYGDAGSIRCEKVNDKHYKTTHTDLYPDDFTYGLAYGYARRLLPRGTSFKIYYEPDTPRRDDGNAPSTILHITWE